MMKYIYLAILALLTSSCHEIDEWDNNPRGNFDALWTILDEHYCYFKEKNVDWDDVYCRYSARLDDNMTQQELFQVCADMLEELRDGHTNLISSFNTSYYRKWWSDYPQNYDERLWQEYYFNFNYRSINGISFGILPQNIGYVNYPCFMYSIGEGNLDAILAHVITCNGLIIDVRNNGGGELTNVETLVRRFISQRTLAGYIIHKTGPGHNEFSKPYAFYYDPADNGRVTWRKGVVILTNRSTYSAANNFVSIMKYLPNVRVVGDTTGGGSGMPYSSELPNGWGVRFSACPMLDPQGNDTEFGVEPSEGCAVDLDPQIALQGHDTMIDFAINLLNQM